MIEDRENRYKQIAKFYWNGIYLQEGYVAANNAGSYEKTLFLAEKEMEVFLTPTLENVSRLLYDKEVNPVPTFTENMSQHPLLCDILEKDLKDCVALDYGCGFLARYSRAMAPYFKKVVGVDVSDVAINDARKNILKEKKHSNITLIATDGTKVPLKDESLDFCFSNVVFQHIGNKEILLTLISEMSRCLNKGGVVRAQYSDASDIKPAEWQSPYHGNGFETQEIKQAYEDRGFEVLMITPDYHQLWITATKI